MSARIFLPSLRITGHSLPARNFYRALKLETQEKKKNFIIDLPCKFLASSNINLPLHNPLRPFLPSHLSSASKRRTSPFLKTKTEPARHFPSLKKDFVLKGFKAARMRLFPSEFTSQARFPIYLPFAFSSRLALFNST